MGKQAIIIGAGPAGLTAAHELLKRTDIKPIILEKSDAIGGISKTINYKGNRMDIGGHRFFSKSDRVMNWWMNIMPLEKNDEEAVTLQYQSKKHTVYTKSNLGTGESVNPGLVMLIRKRLSRIYFLRKFFNYPIQLSLDTLKKLGVTRTIQIILSYSLAQLFKRKPEKSLEDFLINRFGKKLYLLFFKDYTEKVWGVPCNEISAQWGAQRIKGVSISSAIKHAVQAIIKKKKGANDIAQKDTETSLIEQFLYPALGPGQLWEEVARQIEVLGGKIIRNEEVREINIDANQVTSVITQNSQTGEKTEHTGEYFFSTMPVQELILGMNGIVPADVKEVAAGLQYRDFITVGVLLKKFGAINGRISKTKGLQLKDTWIYIQEKDVKVGRLQLFNNWSPFMVNSPDNVWIGMEYFCNKGDEFWELNDQEIQRTAIAELEKMGLAEVTDVLDSTVHRVEKTYPAYFGTYNKFDKVRSFVDQLENLFLVGRNGMHKYNNSDHSMLTAMTAVDNICEGITVKTNIWAINTEQEYHEEKAKADKMLQKNFNRKIHNNNASVAFAEPMTFKEFLFHNEQNRFYLALAAIALLLQLVIFKFVYPFPNFIHDDSFLYLDMASKNVDIGIYPVGYPRFLRLFNVFTSSDTALVTFQFLCIQCSALYLLFTIFYFYKPAKVVQWILFAFISLNPLHLYLGNLISSDAMFLALSCVWFTTLLWIIHKPSNWVITLHAVTLVLAFSVRYNALIYPFIASIAFLISRLPIYKKASGLALSIMLCSFFILYTGSKYKIITGKWQFSPFSGWQLANNALFGYKYVDSAERKPVPPRFRPLDNIVRLYFDKLRNSGEFTWETEKASTYFMWTRGLPLQDYMKLKFGKDTTKGILEKWASMAPLYREYGQFLIRKYPSQFVSNFLLVNAKNYYEPPVEFLKLYNNGSDTVRSIAQKWFDYKSNKVNTLFVKSSGHILRLYSILFGIMNIVLVSTWICFLALKGWKNNLTFLKFIQIATAVWLINAGFSILASPVALRFQVFSILLITIFVSLLIDWIVKTMTFEIQKMKYESEAPKREETFVKE